MVLGKGAWECTKAGKAGRVDTVGMPFKTYILDSLQAIHKLVPSASNTQYNMVS